METNRSRPEEAATSPSESGPPSDSQTVTSYSTLEVVRHSDLEAYKRASELQQPLPKSASAESKDGQYVISDPRLSKPSVTSPISTIPPKYKPAANICGLPKRTFWIIFGVIVTLCVIGIIVGGAVGGTRHRDSQSSNLTAAEESMLSASFAPTTKYVTITMGPTTIPTTSASLSSSPTTTPTTTTPVCVGGTGTGNYVGLCAFACSYDYCPPGPCTCTSSGTPLPTPPTTGIDGIPLTGEDDSYLGLCSYCCNHGYCPASACTTKAS